jgi:hypothetical protein
MVFILKLSYELDYKLGRVIDILWCEPYNKVVRSLCAKDISFVIKKHIRVVSKVVLLLLLIRLYSFHSYSNMLLGIRYGSQTSIHLCGDTIMCQFL